MPGNFRKDDLRIIKTHKSLIDALKKLLTTRNFNRLTVNDLCEEAKVSRPTFYVHFDDKYDILRHWLNLEAMQILKTSKTIEDIKVNTHEFMLMHAKMLTNLVEDANRETTQLLHEVMVLLLDLECDAQSDNVRDYRYMTLLVFCTGGMVNFLSWQADKKFPPELEEMITYMFEMVCHLIKRADLMKTHWEGESLP